MRYRMNAVVAGLLALVVVASGCSTTKNLPEGEVLYTGYKINNPAVVEHEAGKLAVSEVEAALQKNPTTKLFGVIPFPFGMWVYNSFVKYEKGFGHWVFDHFAPKPVFISTVNPEVRAKAATNLLHDYGYFNGSVTSKVVGNRKDSLKASVEYMVDMRNPYVVDTMYYQHFAPKVQKLIDVTSRRSAIVPGKQFSVIDLATEKNRISTVLRNMGYYYFRPDFLTYQADTTLVPGGHVSLRMRPAPGLPEAAQRQFYVGKTSVYLLGRKGEKPTHKLTYKDMDIHYYQKLKVKPKMLYKWTRYQSYVKKDGAKSRRDPNLYSEFAQKRVQEKIAQTGIFSYIDMLYTPRDTTASCDTLDLRIMASFDKPLDAELSVDVKTKSNDQTGPGAAFSLTKKNVFGGGESWNVELNGSYEWQTGANRGKKALNSWEFGLSTSLTFPRVLFPTHRNKVFDFPATTTVKLYANQLNRASYYKMLAFGGNLTYDFQPYRTRRHSLTPFRLTFNVLQSTSPAFEEISSANPALYLSMENQFIPMMEYTYTYDSSPIKKRTNQAWWQTTVASAGNITSCIYRIFGREFSEKDKNLMGSPFAQYLKLSTDFRYTWKFGEAHQLATRIAGGVIWAYGNKTIAPYSEQFYVGGANSIRAFTIRSIGPGGSTPKKGQYAFLDQTGDIRLEANVEYRFRIWGGLQGAVFLDAGNVWLMRKDPNRPNAELNMKRFGKEIALGTGLGIRYDLDFLVFRLDCGVPLHDPYDTGKAGYYNVRGKFWKQLGWHFAIGYPF